ncbi:MAG: hypothetical protein LBH05_04360 [Deferribacteraceae bacterium]|jgi:hypothetical protein|nr:hypothetical protein [Deferribacteraceae bacterium]
MNRKRSAITIYCTVLGVILLLITAGCMEEEGYYNDEHTLPELSGYYDNCTVYLSWTNVNPDSNYTYHIYRGGILPSLIGTTTDFSYIDNVTSREFFFGRCTYEVATSGDTYPFGKVEIVAGREIYSCIYSISKTE